MPDIEEILEILQRNVDATRERMHHLLEEEGLNELPARLYDQVVVHINAGLNALTAGGTLPALIPSLPTLNHDKQVARPPPVPLSYWDRMVNHVQSRPRLYAALSGVSFTCLATVVAVNVSPAFRTRLFAVAPWLRPVYVRGRRALPPIPRPRLSPNGQQRLEAVLVLGCDQGSHGREVAKAFARRGFVVIASLSDPSETDELEFMGEGFIKALVLNHTSPETSQVSQFVRSLNTALSLQYPLKSAGDPFLHHNTGNSHSLQLVSVINCIPISGRHSGAALPLEALPVDHVSQTFNMMVSACLLLLQSIIPMLRLAHDPHGLPATVITCLPGPDRLVAAPLTGIVSALPGIASNALASALDLLRRELSMVEHSAKRQVKIVNVDVGFLQPVNTKKSHRGVTHPADCRQQAAAPTLAAIERALPAHLREMYAPALLANFDKHAESSRKRLPGSCALSDKLLSIVLAKKARHIPDRTSVGVGVTSYYVASLLPTKVIDTFLRFRFRLLKGLYTVPAASQAANQDDKPRPARRPLPLPGEAPSNISKTAEAAMERSQMHAQQQDEPVLPPYALSEDSSVHSSAYSSSATSPLEASTSIATRHDSEQYGSQSGYLGESYVRV